MRNIRYFLSLIVLSLVFSGCGATTLTLRSPDGQTSVEVRAEIADTQKEREKGLMDRTHLGENEGMLFAFAEPQIMSFWMKNTLIPLDIFFFDEHGEFVSYTAMEPCTKDPCAVYKSAALSVYALEMPKGFREAHKIGVGWTLDMKAVERAVSVN